VFCLWCSSNVSSHNKHKLWTCCWLPGTHLMSFCWPGLPRTQGYCVLDSL
jgi:hypothetical protein